MFLARSPFLATSPALTLRRNGERCRRHARACGVGHCELLLHRSMFDFIAVSGTTENRVTEFVDHLHERFMKPVVIRNARYIPPIASGYSAEIKRSSRRRYHFPNGETWQPAS